MKLSLILVPVKDLPLDEEVLHLAFSLVAPVGDRRNKQRAKIEIIHVIEVPQALPLDAELPEAVQHGEGVLAQAEQLAHQRDVEVSAEMLQARSAGVAIVDEAVERGADIIIMGARTRRLHGEYHMGNTLPYVFKNAPCRVVVNRAARAESELK